MYQKITIVLILLTIISKISYGQNDFREGFIISLKNDTIQGQVEYRSNLKNYKSCVFKDDGDINEYFPDQIKGFGYYNDRFFSSQIKDDSFVEGLVLGEISLYKSRYAYLLKKDSSIYALESSIEEIEVEGKTMTKEASNWRGVLTFLISDCMQNPGGITSKMKLKEKSLTLMAIKYNECRGTEFKEYKVSKPWTEFDFGVIMGAVRSQITTEASGTFSYLDKSYSSIDPTIGVVMAISSPRITEKIAFQGELHFLQSRYASLVALTIPLEAYHDTFIETTTLSIPLSLKYSFPKNKVGLYMQGGINLDYHLSSETRVQSEIIRNLFNRDIVNTLPERKAFEVNDSQVGFWGGVGLLESFRSFRGSVAIRYFYMPAFNETDGFAANNHRISLNLILFKK